MPEFRIPKGTVEGPPIIPEGRVVLRLDGFKPALSKNKDSINYNPQFKVVSPSENADQRIFFNMNSGFRPGIVDLTHAFGKELVPASDGSGDYVIPGKFTGPDDDMTRWIYEGPLLGEICEVDLVVEPKLTGDGQQNSIKRFYCTVPGCQEKHSLDLIGKR